MPQTLMDQNIIVFEKFRNVVILYGRDILLAMVILVVGLVVAKMVHKLLGRTLIKFTSNPNLVSVIKSLVFVLILVFVIASALHQAGMASLVVRRIIVAVTLAVVFLIILFRPYIPTLPFKVGNTIKTGDLLGKVEATTLLNTRLRTFDGKTVFVPNSKILNDYVINYHFTPYRRFEVEVGIGYDQDLLRAKQVLEEIMIEDPRVLISPRPTVYVTNLADSCVELSARGWVENIKYWKTKCDLLEKAKLRLDYEGIKIAFPQRDVHLYHERSYPVSKGASHET